MSKLGRRIILIICVLICAGAVWECGKAQVFYVIGKRTGSSGSQQDSTEENLASQAAEPNFFSEELFYEKAERQGTERLKAEEYWNILLADNIFQDGTMELTGLVIEDMDGNGQKDMLVMILDRETKPFYGSGCVWIYMNEDEPYCFDAEECSYYGNFESFAEDIDNDGNVEIVLSAQGTGNGATGDFYKVIWKYKDHGIERMELPSDLGDDYYDQGILVQVCQEPEENRYSAYCPYFEETICFDAENVFEPSEFSEGAGSNVRGFFDLCPVKYQGENALQASEYLHGEGGIVHGVATAQFIILWDENGKGYVDTWWIEGQENSYFNNNGGLKGRRTLILIIKDAALLMRRDTIIMQASWIIIICTG